MVKGHHSRTCLSASKCPPLCISSPPQHHYTTSKPPCSGAHQLHTQTYIIHTNIHHTHTQTYIIHTHKHTYQGFIQKGGSPGISTPKHTHKHASYIHTQTYIICKPPCSGAHHKHTQTILHPCNDRKLEDIS